MRDYEIQSQDGTILRGTLFDAPAKPKAVISLVHGFGEHCNRYAHMAAHLKTKGIAVAAIDLRGHGRSEGKRGVCKTYENFREDVDALLGKVENTYPDLPNILMGHSMGGGLVLNYTLTRGTSTLVGVISQAPLLKVPRPPGKMLEIIVKLLRKIAPNMTLGNPIDGSKVTTIEREAKIYEDDPLNHGSLGVGLAVDMIEGGQWVLDNADKWTTPLLIMHARNDQLTDFFASEAFAGAANNCQFVAYENVEHEIHNDTSRDDVYAEIVKFVKAQI